MTFTEAMKVAKQRRAYVDRPPDGYRWGFHDEPGRPLIVKLPREKRIPKRCRACGSRHAELDAVTVGPGMTPKIVGYQCHYGRECERRRIGKAIAEVLLRVNEAIAKCRGKRARAELGAYRNGLNVGIDAAAGRGRRG